jgi:hypothetical protein
MSRLESIQQEIREKTVAFDREIVAFGRLSLKHANEIGDLYNALQGEVKAQGKKWQPWLKENYPDAKPRTVGLYMQVAKNYNEHLATVANNNENFTLKDAQQLLNEISPRKRRQPKPSEPDLLTNVKRAGNQYQQYLTQLMNTDLDSHTHEAVADTLKILASIESLNHQVRNKLVLHQLPSANNTQIQQCSFEECPMCNSNLSGLVSCMSCGWNVGEMPRIYNN